MSFEKKTDGLREWNIVHSECYEIQVTHYSLLRIYSLAITVSIKIMIKPG